MVKIETVEQEIPVYDVTVEGNENFYADGFLVHNCGEILLRDREFCNLSEVVVRASDTMEDLERKVRLAAVIGTMQCTLTDFKYISKKWRDNCEEERLLGVSLTGIMDSELTNGKKKGLAERLARLREIARETNVEWAQKFGVAPSKAVTCVKPSGCTTLDTKIRVRDGEDYRLMSMAEIFAETTEDAPFNAGDWYTPSKLLYVRDENDDEKLITKLFVNGLSVVYEIETDDGRTYKFTGEHKLKTTTGWKRVDELTDSDEIVSWEHEKYK